MNKFSVQEEKRLVKELRVPDHVLHGPYKNDVGMKKGLEISGLIQQGVKLAMVLGGANGTELQNKTLRFGSPRLLSVVPDDVDNQVNLKIVIVKMNNFSIVLI